MKQPAESLSFVQRGGIGGLFDHTDDIATAAHILADRAGIGLRDIAADRAGTYSIFDLADRVGYLRCFLFGEFQDMKRHSGGRFSADPGEPGESVDETFN
jgi:hypothetical protein